MATRLLALLLLLTAGAAIGDTVYRSQDEQGRPVFTDQPAPGAREVELPPVNTLPRVELPAAEAPAPAQPLRYSSLDVDVPSIVPNGLAPLTIGIRSEPTLQAGHRWRLILDGVLVAESDGEGVTFPQMDRGEHHASAEIIDQVGRIVAESEAVSFFVYWPGGNR